MKISTKGRYALRLMMDLAENNTGSPISLKDVAKRQDISDKYLEQIISILNKAGYVRSVRGAQGGYMLKMEQRSSVYLQRQSLRAVPRSSMRHMQRLLI